MPDNEHYLAKADNNVATFAPGGVLVAEQSKEFMELATKEGVLLPLAQTKPLANPTFELNNAGFTGRVLHAAIEAQALTESQRSEVATSKVVLNTKEFIGELRISYSALEDQIMQDRLMQFLVGLGAKAVSRDLEDFIINGDTTSADADYAAMDGLLKQITTYVSTSGGIRLSAGVLKLMSQLMPSEFWSGAQKLAYLTSKNAGLDYWFEVANRPTPLGDKMLMQGAVADFAGISVIPIPLMPENLGAGTDETNVVLMDPKNLVVGIQREITIEPIRIPQARVWSVTITVRADNKLRHEPAATKATEILATAA